MSGQTITPAEQVGRQVRAALAEQLRPQRDLEAVLGLTHTAVSRRMLGQMCFRADELIAIAEHLGVDPGRFLAPIPQQRPATQLQAVSA